MKLVNIRDSKSRGSNPLRVRVPPQALSVKENEAYLIGLALGDGNLSNPNGRAVRLRITCDKNYPNLINEVLKVMQLRFPANKVGMVDRKGCVDVYVYSNELPSILGWRWDGGPKDVQGVKVPNWIKSRPQFVRACLRGLFQTDGCAYQDRGYTMLNFVNTCQDLAEDVIDLIERLGYKPNLQILQPSQNKMRQTKYTIRVSKNAEHFIKEIGYWKA